MTSDEFTFEDLFGDLVIYNDFELLDLDKKDIGDRVIISNKASLSYFNGEPVLNSEILSFYNEEYLIVVNISQKVKYKSTNKIYLQDLIIANPKTNKLYRISSKHVKLYEL